MGEFEDQFGDEFEEEEVWEDVEETEGADMETDNADEAEKPRHQVFVPGKSDVEPNADLEYDSSAYALASTVSSGGYWSIVPGCYGSMRACVQHARVRLCACDCARAAVRVFAPVGVGACVHARHPCTSVCVPAFASASTSVTTYVPMRTVPVFLPSAAMPRLQVRDVPPTESGMAVHDLRLYPRRPGLSAKQIPHDVVRLLWHSGIERPAD